MKDLFYGQHVYWWEGPLYFTGRVQKAGWFTSRVQPRTIGGQPIAWGNGPIRIANKRLFTITTDGKDNVKERQAKTPSSSSSS